jgi:EpsI family protein
METLTMIAVLLVDLFGRPCLHALVIVAAAPPLAFALNGLRVLALVLSPHSEILAIHTVQGVAILLGGLLLLYGLDGLLERLLARPARAAAAPGPERTPAAAPGASGPLAALAACAALALWLEPWPDPGVARYALAFQIPPVLGAWQSTDLGVDRAYLGRAEAGQVLHRQYRSGADAVNLFLSVGDRSQRARSPFSPVTGYPGSGWTVEEEGRLRLGREGPVVTRRVVRAGIQRVLLYHWSEGRGGLAEESLRSALALDASPLRRAEHGLVVRLATAVPPGGEDALRDAQDRLVRFYLDLRGDLRRLEARLGQKTFS